MELNRRQVITAAASTVLLGLSVQDAKALTPVLKNGIDISWLPIYEQNGGKFYTTANKEIEAFALMKATGVKVVRIRVFVNPSYRNGKLSDALALAARAKTAGLDTCIDLHFSDDWADPGHQNTPAGWSTTDVNVLAGQLKSYVVATLTEFKSRGLEPGFVQLGNEITYGMIWPLGRMDSGNQSQWKNLAQLYNAACTGLRQVFPNAKNVLHLDIGGNANWARWWLMQAASYRMRDYDVVGLSYYPQWQGDLKKLTETLEMVAFEFNKPVVIAETAYPYTTTRFGGDVIDVSKGVLAGYPATQAGQASYLKKLNTILKTLYGGNGLGVWWWEGLATRVTRNGAVVWDSGMTNSTLVDQNGKALSALANMKG